MGSSGGTPSPGGGFFPGGMQMNPGGLPIMDLMGWLNSGGMQAQPLNQSIFGQPPQAAPPMMGGMASRGMAPRQPGKEQFQTFGDLANMMQTGRRPVGANNPRYSR
jgi:hypothetical protein